MGQAVDFAALSQRLDRVHSARLALRPPAMCDAWPLYAATRNELFNRYLLWDAPVDDRQVIDRIEAIIHAVQRGRMAAVSAVVKATGEWIGLFKFQPCSRSPDSIEMGVWMHDKFWHGKYALELGKMCVDAAFNLTEAAVLVGAAAPENKSSRRLMELCGLRQTVLVDRPRESGTSLALQEYEIHREAWLGAHVLSSGRLAHASIDQARRSEHPVVIGAAVA